MFFIKKFTVLKFIIICLFIIPYFYVPSVLVLESFSVFYYNIMVLGFALLTISSYVFCLMCRYYYISYFYRKYFYSKHKELLMELDEDMELGIHYIIIIVQVVTYIMSAI